ncbi:hypothetical protein ACFPH6_06715 [Streptomyces xiangluensis]|uniref:Uncharacterized protein n=1 Tax=Streptomyces xiangluensis TaxID=2665720 RepID=A0ABV8YJD1_9ACTN
MISTIAMPGYLFIREPIVLVALSAIIGFVLMAGMPTALDWSEVIAGRENAGPIAVPSALRPGRPSPPGTAGRGG